MAKMLSRFEMEQLDAGAEPDKPGDREQAQRLGEQIASIGQGAEEEQAERQHRQRHDLDEPAAR